METLKPGFDKYQILEKLASGGMADIHLAVPKVLSKNASTQNQLLVIKRVIEGTANRPEYLSSLKDEAKALSRLKHPNIVAFKEFVEENDQCYLVMEYVQGKSLQQMIQESNDSKQGIAIEHILHIVSEIANGLDYAHNSFDQYFQKFLNLVHRDINPQNIMISSNGEVKIIDFGISKFDLRDEQTKTGLIKGKISYLSPEQIMHKPVDARTDIYALGVVFWELLAGRKLFDSKSNSEKINKIKENDIPSLLEINPSIPSSLNQIVMKALASAPENRYQTALDFRYEVLSYMATIYPLYNVRTFKALVKNFQSEKKSGTLSGKNEFTITERIDSPVGLIVNNFDSTVKPDFSRHRKYISKGRSSNHLKYGSLRKQTSSKKYRQMERQQAPNQFIDVVLNLVVMSSTIAFLGYALLFYYKTGYLKPVVSFFKQILNLV